MNKPTKQSTTYTGNEIAWGPKLAVDGNTNGDPSKESSSCTHTNKKKWSYWRVDLGDSFSVQNVVLYNRYNFRELIFRMHWYFFLLLDMMRMVIKTILADFMTNRCD